MKFKNTLLVVIIIMTFGFVGVGNAVEITFENCQPGTWIGGVKWKWKDGIRGSYQGSTYVAVPEIELRRTGSAVVDLEPGDYAITHYRPAVLNVTAGGQMFRPAAILDFREITVSGPVTHSFGCEE